MQGTIPSTTAVPPPPRPLDASGRLERPRHLQTAAFIAALAGYFSAKALAASAASGLGTRLDLDQFRPVLQAGFEVFLVVIAVALLAAIERRRAPLRLTLGLPARRSARTEWGEGLALGWGVAVACVLPMLLGGTLDVRFWTAPRAWEVAAASVLTLALLTLSNALGVYGYALQRLIQSTGPVRATLLLALLAAIQAWFEPNAGGSPVIRAAVGFAATILLCLCWIRTHGLWLLWGLHFGWAVGTAVVFGLPLAGSGAYNSVVESRALGPDWLTGADFGPGAALPSLLVVVLAIAVLIRLTGEYAWNYTHPPIIPAGYEVDVPPPSAHAAMETAPPPAPALVQILPATPGGPSSTPGPE